MGARSTRLNKKQKIYTVSIDTFIERLKKIRALNCNPADVGLDNYVLKRTAFDTVNILTKFL